MNGCIRIANEIADSIVNVVKWFEEWDSSAVALKGVRRSLQLDRYSCGVQSVKVILDYFSKRLSLEDIEQKLGTDENGTSPTAVRQLFRSLGLSISIEGQAELRDIKKMIDSGRPVLVSIANGEHWAVVYGYSKRSIYVADPSIEKNFCCRMSKARFLRQWNRWMMAAWSNR
jgi:ABC-type bacteriocin/lantibiotic exporter with double-glycine peptidase domain